MRTLPVKTLGAIAVMTENLKSRRVIIFLNPVIKFVGRNLLTVFVAFPVDMVKAQELNNRFTTTSTLWNSMTVMSQHL